MTGSSPIDEALQRLAGSLDRLEEVVDHHLETVDRTASLEGELHQLGTDRSRLAKSLDAAEARSARLEEANREVSRRLVAAMESIREVLARHG